jgi:adenylylsulfate kinase
MNALLEVCEYRDVKGLYKKARSGEIKNFTGGDAIYEVPEQPGVTLSSSAMTIKECVVLVR